MRRTIKLIAVMCVFAGVSGEALAARHADEAKNILQKSQAALKKVKLVTYDGDFTATGWVAARMATVEGKTVLGEPSQWGLDRFRCEVKLKPSGSDAVMELTAGSNGDRHFLMDPRRRYVYEDLDSLILGSHGRDILRLLLREFTSADPFQEALESKNVQLAGTATIGGEECHKLVISSGGRAEAEWFLSTKDFLPRRHVRLVANRRDPDGAPGRLILTVTGLRVNPKLDGDPFTIIIPAGYTKTDDFPK